MTNTQTTLRRGLAAPPILDSPPDVSRILAQIEQREFIPLAPLAEQLGISEQTRQRAIREGLIETAPVKAPDCRGHLRVRQVERDEALSLLLAAVLAFAAGVAVVVMIKAVKGAGLSGAAAAATLANMP